MGLVRTLKQGETARGTHSLDRKDIGTSQGTETKRGSEGDSLAGEGRYQDWLGFRNKARQWKNLLAGEGRWQDWSG